MVKGGRPVSFGGIDVSKRSSHYPYETLLW
jgi:hypothetical protein